MGRRRPRRASPVGGPGEQRWYSPRRPPAINSARRMALREALRFPAPAAAGTGCLLGTGLLVSSLPFGSSFCNSSGCNFFFFCILKILIFIFVLVCRGALSTELLSIRAPGGRSKGRDGGRGGGEGAMGSFFSHLVPFIYLFRLEKASRLGGSPSGDPSAH